MTIRQASRRWREKGYLLQVEGSKESLEEQAVVEIGVDSLKTAARPSHVRLSES